jgi:hypothetical protein
LQIEPFKFASDIPTLLVDKPIGVNFIYLNPGPYPVTDRHSFEALFLAERSDLPSDKGFNEREIVDVFEKPQKEQYERNRDIPTPPVGRDQSYYKSVAIPPLTEKQVSGILDGSVRLYALAWATWKDSRNKAGTVEVCCWLQPPKSTDLLSPQLVWHRCTEPF